MSIDDLISALLRAKEEVGGNVEVMSCDRNNRSFDDAVHVKSVMFQTTKSFTLKEDYTRNECSYLYIVSG